MDNFTISAAEVDRHLARGLRQRWWCIGPSAMFQDTPVALTRLGEALVGWRDAEGVLHVVQDRCPHRGAALSIGRVIDGDLACSYHGVRIGEGGVVTAVPGLPNCALVGRKLVKSYPVVEHFQAVFAYFGDAIAPEPPELGLPEELLSEEWTGFVMSATWHNNHLFVLDNALDPLHTRYLHENSYSMGIDEASDYVDVADSENGFTVTRRNDKSNIEAMQFVDTGTFYVRVGISQPPVAGPGGNLRVIATVVPIDERHAQINFWRLRKMSGWQAAMWRFMFNMRLDSFAWEVVEQDRAALETLPPWPPVENLYQHDAGVVRMRRLMRREAERQLRTLAGQELASEASPL